LKQQRQNEIIHLAHPEKSFNSLVRIHT